MSLVGCGSVTPVGTDGGTGTAGDGAGSSGAAGRGGVSGSAGTAGTTGAGNAAGGGSGGVATAGTGGAAAGGRGGAAGGRGGVDGTAGRGGATSGGGSGGVATGGRGGGNAGSGGVTGLGGVTTGGRGGSAGAIGVGGLGGVAIGGRGGGNAGTGGAAVCARGMCPALMIGDLEAIDDSKAPGFDAPGFRCKTLTICPLGGSCSYSSTTMFGNLQSAEDTYYDGAESTVPAAVTLRIDGGAASQCNNPPITFTTDDALTLTFDGGKKVPVYLPAFMGTSLSLYIATDGSTFYDAALTQPARLRP